MSNLSVLLSPEGETLWIRRPEILLLIDYAFMDEHDYKRIQSRAGRSDLDSQSAALLEAYTNEGYVKLIDYKKELPLKNRKNVYNLSKEVIGSMTFEERKNAGVHSHTNFASYLGAKLEHLNPGEPLFKKSAAARKKIIQNIQEIQKLNPNIDEYPSHVEELQRRSISKWIAAEELAHKFNAHFVFDLDGYKPYAKKIRESITWKASPLSTKSLFLNDRQVPFKIMWEAVKTQLPVLNIENTDDLLRFNPKRKEFNIFRGILRDLVAFYEEVQDADILRNYADRKLKDAIDLVQTKMNSRSRKMRRYLPTCLSYLLKKVFVPNSGNWLQEKVREEQSKELFDHVKDAYQKLCCFSFYATRKPIPKVQITEIDEKSRAHWVTGASLAWYETDKKSKIELE